VTEHLTSHHRDTLAKIFSHPTSANIEWRQVESLLEAVADRAEEHDGKLKVTVRGETLILEKPHGKDVELPTIVELRRFLTVVGLAPDDQQAS
jgi:hypothetical protein